MRTALPIITSLLTLGLASTTPLNAQSASQPAGRSAQQPAGQTSGAGGTRGWNPTRFERVDPTVEDINPLRFSLFNLSTDLRVPSGFDAVFRVPDPNAPITGNSLKAKGAAANDHFARVSGALTAIFPRSDYAVNEESGLMAKVPPGTVYYIGGPQVNTIPSQSPAPTPLELQPIVTDTASNSDRLRPFDARFMGTATDKEAPAAAKRPPRRPSISMLDDDEYRSRRLSQLLSSSLLSANSSRDAAKASASAER